MRKPMQDTISAKLQNGLTVKGSYKHSIRGCYIDLYVMNQEGYILGSKSFAIIGMVTNAQDRLVKGIETMRDLLTTYKVDQVTSAKVLQVVVPFVINRAFDKSPVLQQTA